MWEKGVLKIYAIFSAKPDHLDAEVSFENLVIGDTANVKISFHSNPAPHTFQWNLHDLDKPVNLTLVPRAGQPVVNGRYTFEPIVQVRPIPLFQIRFFNGYSLVAFSIAKFSINLSLKA